MFEFYDPVVMSKSQNFSEKSREEQKILEELINRPDFLPTAEDEKILIRQYSSTLKKRKEALIRFLSSVDWKNQDQRKDAMKLFEKWEKPDIY